MITQFDLSPKAPTSSKGPKVSKLYSSGHFFLGPTWCLAVLTGKVGPRDLAREKLAAHAIFLGLIVPSDVERFTQTDLCDMVGNALKARVPSV